MLKDKPIIKQRIINIPINAEIDSPSPDELPEVTTVSEAKAIIRQCERIINDIYLQKEHKQTYVNLAYVENVEETILEQEAKFNLWWNKTSKKLRTTYNKLYIYKEALLQAGIDDI
jgi:hypothetical protein